ARADGGVVDADVRVAFVELEEPALVEGGGEGGTGPLDGDVLAARTRQRAEADRRHEQKAHRSHRHPASGVERTGLYFLPGRWGGRQAVAAWFELISRGLRLLFSKDSHTTAPFVTGLVQRLARRLKVRAGGTPLRR